MTRSERYSAAQLQATFNRISQEKFFSLKVAKDLGNRLVAWYRKNKIPHPWRLAFASTNDPYLVWVSEIMLQQTVIKAVLPKYEAFIAKFPTIMHLASAQEQEIKKYCSGLGYYSRFNNMHKAAKLINSLEHGFPRSKKELLQLPGIGEYTASAIASICFGEVSPVIDGNVERVLCRLCNIALPTNYKGLKKIFAARLTQMIPRKFPGDFNQGMMELGQLVCTVQNPKCEICVFNTACLSFKKNNQNHVPLKKQKQGMKNINLMIHVPIRRKKVFIIERNGNSPFLKNSTGFALQIIDNSAVNLFEKSTIQIPRFSHTITNHKINAFIKLTKEPIDSPGNWLGWDQVLGHLSTSLDIKTYNALAPRMGENS